MSDGVLDLSFLSERYVFVDDLLFNLGVICSGKLFEHTHEGFFGGNRAVKVAKDNAFELFF